MGKKAKVFTKEEIIEAEELASKYTLNEVAVHFNIDCSTLSKARKRDVKLREAINRGLEKRSSSKNKEPSEAKKKLHIEKYQPMMTFSETDKSALQKFKEEFEANKRKRLKEELKNLDLI